MAANANRLRVDQGGVFTNVEHMPLASWFGQQPPTDAVRIKLDDALAQLGFGKDCRPYSQTSAAVAHILLEAIEDRLPVWAWSVTFLLASSSTSHSHAKVLIALWSLRSGFSITLLRPGTLAAASLSSCPR